MDTQSYSEAGLSNIHTLMDGSGATGVQWDTLTHGHEELGIVSSTSQLVNDPLSHH